MCVCVIAVVLWAHTFKIYFIMLDIPTLDIGAASLWSAATEYLVLPYKLWIRQLKQIRPLTSSTNVNFFFFFWPWWTARDPAAESDHLCGVSTAASLRAKSPKMYHCTDTSLPAWLALWMTSAVNVSLVFGYDLFSFFASARPPSVHFFACVVNFCKFLN